MDSLPGPRKVRIAIPLHRDGADGSAVIKIVRSKLGVPRTVMLSLNKYFPDMEVSAKQNFIYTFFPFMFGIYPYTFVTEKQRDPVSSACYFCLGFKITRVVKTPFWHWN